MKSSEIYQTKRDLLNFFNKLAVGLTKPREKFFRDLFYGISKAQNVLLASIARTLNEPITLKYTIKRLSRNISSSHDLHLFQQNYLDALKTSIPKNPLIIVDESDIVKPYAHKMEGLAIVRDGSKNVLEKGYPTINFCMATEKTKHPLPLYHHIYSTKEKDFVSQNIEWAKGFNYILNLGHQFVTRLKDNRNVIHQNRKIKVPDLASRRKGKITFETNIQGQLYTLKVSHVKVSLPSLKDHTFYMLLVYGFGKKPMKLLTNCLIKGKDDVLRVLKAYLARWRIEELFRVQKQEFQLEKVQTLSLSSLEIIYTVMNCLIGYYSLKIEKNKLHTQVILDRARASNDKSKIKFYLYRFIRGVSNILTFDTAGIRHFHRIESRTNQLSLF